MCNLAVNVVNVLEQAASNQKRLLKIKMKGQLGRVKRVMKRIMVAVCYQLLPERTMKQGRQKSILLNL